MSQPETEPIEEVDPFDLPTWLGEEVRWVAQDPLADTSVVRGRLSPRTGESTDREEPDTLECALLCADQAFPQPLLGEEWRVAAHREWGRGEVLLVRRDGVLTLMVPGTRLNADQVLRAVSRLARAVGSRPDRFLVCLRP